MAKYFILLLSAIISIKSSAQQVRPEPSEKIYKELMTLNKIPKVLYLAAHPDDENTALLSWLVNDQHLQTAYLSLTRGDGGQNLLGREQGAALGLIRTHELLEARKMDGAKQYFTRAIDFGFSKNSEDTFKQWDRDKITSDVVWVIRNFQPDLIICRFPPNSAAGHGQHAASAIIAAEAFKLAGDAQAYPEQLKKVSTWQAERLLWNTFRFGPVNTTSEDQFKVEVGQYDPLLGLGYGELAGISRSLHRSQGAGTPSVPGIRTEYFKLVAGTLIKDSLFDGLAKNWNDLGQKPIENTIQSIIEEFNFTRPDLSLPALLTLRKELKHLTPSSLIESKQKTLEQIILSCVGFMAELVTTSSEAISGESLKFELNTLARSELPVSINSINWLNNKEDLHLNLVRDSLYHLERQLTIPDDAKITQAFWLESEAESGSIFSIDNPEEIGLSVREPELTALLSLQIADEIFSVKVPLSYKNLDPIKGDVVEQLRIVPALNIQFKQKIYFTPALKDLEVEVNFQSKKKLEGALTIKNGSDVLLSQTQLSIPNSTDTSIQITIPSVKLKNIKERELTAEFITKTHSFTKNKHLIQYDHLPTLAYFNEAKTTIINENITVKVKRIGYVNGAGDYIPDFLRLAGLQVDVLQEDNFSEPASLANYDAIITGVRALNAEKKMKKWMPILIQYVKDGGTLLVQFNTLQDLSTDQYSPYPFRIGNKRVTEEDSEVRFFNEKHPLLTSPNQITKDDFKGWVQERGLYFPSSWDERYELLFEMNDTNEKSLKGSILYTPYGKGHYIYTSLALFRQLPAGNIGATKLFFNLISVGK